MRHALRLSQSWRNNSGDGRGASALRSSLLFSTNEKNTVLVTVQSFGIAERHTVLVMLTKEIPMIKLSPVALIALESMNKEDLALIKDLISFIATRAIAGNRKPNDRETSLVYYIIGIAPDDVI